MKATRKATGRKILLSAASASSPGGIKLRCSLNSSTFKVRSACLFNEWRVLCLRTCAEVGWLHIGLSKTQRSWCWHAHILYWHSEIPGKLMAKHKIFFSFALFHSLTLLMRFICDQRILTKSLSSWFYKFGLKTLYFKLAKHCLSMQTVGMG